MALGPWAAVAAFRKTSGPMPIAPHIARRTDRRDMSILRSLLRNLAERPCRLLNSAVYLYFAGQRLSKILTNKLTWCFSKCRSVAQLQVLTSRAVAQTVNSPDLTCQAVCHGDRCYGVGAI